jgi:hypothetical protein
MRGRQAGPPTPCQDPCPEPDGSRIPWTLPNAVAGRKERPHLNLGRQDGFYFKRYVDVSTEYCAWIYYTPEGLYEMSWVGTNSEQPASNGRALL